MRNDILWIITARSGSKGIPHKNIKLLGQYPLLAYRIKSAQSISRKSDVWVSTDSKTYAKIAEEYQAMVPFIRPKELAGDDASSIDVVLHAMHFAINSDKNYEFIGLLEPTSPFVEYVDLLKALNILKSDHNADAIVAVEEVRPNTFFVQDEDSYLIDLALRLQSCEKLGRQSFKRQITPSGGFYIAKWDNFLNKKSFYTKNTIPYLIPDLASLEIDEPIDWQFADFLLANGNVELNKIWK